MKREIKWKRIYQKIMSGRLECPKKKLTKERSDGKVPRYSVARVKETGEIIWVIGIPYFVSIHETYRIMEVTEFGFPLREYHRDELEFE